eukprot:4658366-Pleurochrysis_carterae.AAC.1
MDVEELSMVDRLAKCKKMGEARIEAYCKEHLKQTSIEDKIMTTRSHEHARDQLPMAAAHGLDFVDAMAVLLQAGLPACGSCIDDADKIDAPAPCQGRLRCVLSPPRACMPAHFQHS